MLNASDLLVVQKHDGANEIRKATLDQISDFIQTSDVITYRGTADFTDAADNPAGPDPALGPFNGDLYINTTNGTWAWGANVEGITDVYAGDRAIYNGDASAWNIIQDAIGGTKPAVTAISADLPLIADNATDPSVPNISINLATETDDGTVTLATNADILAGTDGKVPTALQLQTYYCPASFAGLPAA